MLLRKNEHTYMSEQSIAETIILLCLSAFSASNTSMYTHILT
jgi:hypothetical protein